MKFKKFRMSPLNEALLGNQDLGSDDELDIVGTLSYADAMERNRSKKRREVLEDSLEDFDDTMKDFIDDTMRREINIKPTGEMKRMKLSESLFEDVKVVSPAVDDEELIVKSTETSTQQLTEAPVAAPEAPAKKKRARGANEVKFASDYSAEDLWYKVMDELDASLDNEGEGQQVDKQLKARRGERYEKVFGHGDSDIIVYAPAEEDFDFAKRVCAYYGVTYDAPKFQKTYSTGYYPWSMIIHIPEGTYHTEIG